MFWADYIMAAVFTGYIVACVYYLVKTVERKK
jgi:hypothetical protein